MSIEPSISVVIPTWNRARTIGAAVQSALDQTLPPLEILVCDDGSSDDSVARVTAIGDARVKWLSGPRSGRPSIPRNRGIAAARGEWLAFLDSDDVWKPEKLARQMETLKASGHLACCADAWHGGQGRRGVLFKGGKDRLVDFYFMLGDNRVICSSALVHRSLFDKAEGFPEASELKALEDYALWLRISCLTKFDYIADPLLNYTDDPKNSVRAKDHGKWVQRIAIMKDLIGWLRRKRPEGVDHFLRAACRELYIAYAQNLTWPLRRYAKPLLTLLSGKAAT